MKENTKKKLNLKKLKQPLASKVYNQFLEKMLSVFNKLILLRLLWVLYNKCTLCKCVMCMHVQFVHPVQLEEQVLRRFVPEYLIVFH